jgi:hypothetical protein
MKIKISKESKTKPDLMDIFQLNMKKHREFHLDRKIAGIRWLSNFKHHAATEGLSHSRLVD